MPRKGRGGKRRKVCQFCVDQIKVADYKDINRLQKFLTDRSKILPRRISGNCARHQRQVTLAIKRARQVALLPYTSE
ncbi:30S ribosomal protein S18 [Alicyclobacillus sp. ALC3]|uniref:30S ribosomal protein S18 n=1 Tax=Alicyclobacillus sp. ALC3 TaxID=2796143 RepID=UPI002378EC48|nr:30S ribosomal protein S18 [Alicyclobacillus sp. ALC3]WDL99166.1 30S ribosomal protein S18 [Alicyclobacillus sp. ALC3]